MTADEKRSLACLLDTAGDYLRDGYRRPKAAYHFTDDTLPHSLSAVAAEILRCTACPLHSDRQNAVPGEGVAHPLVLVIGEGPGADEDRLGRPFVGKAGQLLDRMLASVGLSRETNCFIANMVKCRPPGNRDPLPEEIAPCSRFLARQIRLLNPKLILCVGRVSAHALLKTDASMGSLRGSFTPYQVDNTGGGYASTIPLLATYHPSALLRDESYKRPAWEDLKLLKQRLMELDPDYAGEAVAGGV
jgi:DNA polymerase